MTNTITTLFYKNNPTRTSRLKFRVNFSEKSKCLVWKLSKWKLRPRYAILAYIWCMGRIKYDKIGRNLLVLKKSVRALVYFYFFILFLYQIEIITWIGHAIYKNNFFFCVRFPIKLHNIEFFGMIDKWILNDFQGGSLSNKSPAPYFKARWLIFNLHFFIRIS